MEKAEAKTKKISKAQKSVKQLRRRSNNKLRTKQELTKETPGSGNAGKRGSGAAYQGNQERRQLN